MDYSKNQVQKDTAIIMKPSTWLKKQTQKQQSPTTTWFVYKNYLITMLNTAVNDAYARQSGPIPYITSLLEAENPILNMKIEETLF